ncbi:MAG: DMT family transporter [Gammaproteobacteria bacterium]|nr:DMT family transporter [Gammaproteobacteria bacterium]
MKYALLTALTMIAFASNSLLCRVALGEESIDAASFTSIRLISGAAMLALLMLYRERDFSHKLFNLKQFNPVSVLMLYVYAACFSFSYINLTVATGALILFGAVQLTMTGFAIAGGERYGLQTWAGIIIAFGGLVYLLLPGVSTPPLFSALLMICAGAAWGIYTLRGRGSKAPLLATGWNFIGTVPLALVTLLVFRSELQLTGNGVILAIVSGALASGLGYALWYSVLPQITASSAATVQLSVPVIAAVMGLLMVGEPISLRLVIASMLVLGGIYLTIRAVAGSRNNQAQGTHILTRK